LEDERSFWTIGFILVAATALMTWLHFARMGEKLRLSAWQGYLAYFLMGIQFLWAVPVATVIIWASIYSATR